MTTKAPITPQALETYRSLMWEIKFRIEAIDDVLNGKLRIRQKIAEEFCYLQLRMICEVIAIACLVVHGNLKPRPKLFESYKASWIISELGKLHSKFFPRALGPDGREADGMLKFVEKTGGFLTQDELEKLWERHTGTMLHRGSAKVILGKADRPVDFKKIGAWRTKIVALLERHTLVTPDEEQMIYVVMHEQGTGNVVSNVFELQQRDAYPR
jgi:hypothetical protein